MMPLDTSGHLWSPRCPEIDLMMASQPPLPVQQPCHIRTGSWIRLDQGGGLLRSLSDYDTRVKWDPISPGYYSTCGQARVDCLQYWLHPNLELSGSNKKLDWFIWNFLMPKLDLIPSLELLMPSQFDQISKYLIQKLNVNQNQKM